MNIGDLFVSLMVDNDREFKGQVSRVAAEAATEAGQATGSAMTKALSSAMSIGKGALSAGFGILTRGIQQNFVGLDRAMADFGKETGLVGEQARFAEDAIKDMAANNLQPISEIGDVMTLVVKDMQLTGQAAEDAAQQMLTYAQATGQDASMATGTFDDIQDRLGIDMAESAKIMDALIYNTQTYGGTVMDQQNALKQMIPTLQAANMEWEEGLSILGFFEGVGVQSTQAVMGLNRAIKTLKPGEDLQDLFDRFASIEDAQQRATAATKVFGRTAGPQLANALGQGRVDLEALRLAEEDYIGTTQEAAQASLTWSDRFQLALNKMVGTATQILGPVGPLFQSIGGLTQTFGPAFQNMLSGAFRGAAEAVPGLVSNLTGAASNAGVEMASELGSGFIGELSGSTIAEGAAGTIAGNLTAQVATTSKAGAILGFRTAEATVAAMTPVITAGSAAAGVEGAASYAAANTPAMLVAGTQGGDAAMKGLITSLAGGGTFTSALKAMGAEHAAAYGLTYSDELGRYIKEGQGLATKAQMAEAIIGGQQAGAAGAQSYGAGQTRGLARVMPRVAAAFAAMGTAVGTAFDLALGAAIAAGPAIIVGAIAVGVLALAGDPKLQRAALEIAGGIVKFVAEGIGNLAKGGLNIAMSLVQIISNGLVAIGKGVLDLGSAVFEAFLQAGRDIATAVSGGIKDSGEISEAVREEIEKGGEDAEITVGPDNVVIDQEAFNKALQGMTDLMTLIGGGDIAKGRAEVERLRDSMIELGEDWPQDPALQLKIVEDALAAGVFNSYATEVDKVAAAQEFLGTATHEARDQIAALIESWKAGEKALQETPWISAGFPRELAEQWEAEAPTLKEIGIAAMGPMGEGIEEGLRTTIIEAAGLAIPNAVQGFVDMLGPAFADVEVPTDLGGVGGFLTGMFGGATDAARGGLRSLEGIAGQVGNAVGGVMGDVSDRITEEAREMAAKVEAARGTVVNSMRDIKSGFRESLREWRRLGRGPDLVTRGVRNLRKEVDFWGKASRRGSLDQRVFAQEQLKQARERLRDFVLVRNQLREEQRERRRRRNQHRDDSRREGADVDHVRGRRRGARQEEATAGAAFHTRSKAEQQDIKDVATVLGVSRKKAARLYDEHEGDMDKILGKGQELEALDPVVTTTVNVVGEEQLTSVSQQIDAILAKDNVGVNVSVNATIHRQHGGRVRAGQPTIVGEDGAELWVPDHSGTVFTSGQVSTVSGAGGGTTYNTQVYGLPQRVETPSEVVGAIRRSARLGLPLATRRQQGFNPVGG